MAPLVADTSIPLPILVFGIIFLVPLCIVDVRILRLDLHTFVAGYIALLTST